MDKETALDILFKMSICALYDMEKEVLLNLGELAEHAILDLLGDSFLQHREETKQQIARLDKVMQLTGITDEITKLSKQPFNIESLPFKGRELMYIQSSISEGANGIIKILQDGKTVLSHFVTTEAVDMAILTIGQKVAHYEIASYNSTCMLANYLDYKKAADFLRTSLDEEIAMEKRLIEIAQTEMHVSL